MPTVSRVARFIFHVTLRQVPDFSFLSDVMPASCCPSYLPCHALAKKRELSSLYRHCEAWESRISLKTIPSSSLRTDKVGGGLAFGIPLSPIVIARLRKAEYCLRQSPPRHYERMGLAAGWLSACPLSLEGRGGRRFWSPTHT